MNFARRYIGLGLLAAAAPAGAQVTLNASSWVPPQHALTAAMLVPLCQDMEKATSGRVKCNVLPKHPVAPPQTFDAIRDGVIDLSFATHGYNPGRFSLTEAVEFPFMGDTATASSVAYQRIFERRLAKYDEHKGVVPVAMFTHGPGVLYNTKRSVKELKDLQGMKVRVGAATVSDIMAALGTVPLLKPATESYELMSSGVADGTVMPKESPVSFKFVPLVKHVTFVPGGMYSQSFAWVMNPAKWNAISEADRKLIQPLFGEAMSRRSGHGWDAADARGWAAIQEAKIPIVIADRKFIADMKARTDPLEQAWSDKKAKPKGVDGIALLKELRAEIAKVSKEN
jgi:TRAP-type C4-dicarboxylate transport system substrate-binding protein